MSDQKLKIAVFIDFDNVEIGVKTTLGLQFDIGAVLEAIKERGEVITKVAYGDWKRSGDYARAMANHAVRLVQRVMTPGGDKNGADINLALDALEMAFTHAHINAFVIVGGDSDFITLVEKLKQYDRKVFVVGGRAFTSQVMQKNCTEFIAYENVVPDRRPSPKQERGDRPRVVAAQPIEQAVPLVRRALKVLTDREVSPQLGLLKSTLLQLDSSFSERNYGVSSFRDFADRLEQQGLVTLKHSGRTTLVELSEGGAAVDEAATATATTDGPVAVVAAGSISSAREAGRRAARELFDSPGAGPSGQTDDGAEDEAPRRDGPDAASLGDGVALVRRLLGEAAAPPRWPMYPRQFKQFLKTAHPEFDERRYGSIADLMRACQKDGILRLERDRQGGLRVFGNGATASRASVPHGWGLVVGNPSAAEAMEAADVMDAVGVGEPLPSVVAEPIAVAAEVAEEAAPPKKKRATRARKTAAGGTGTEKKKPPARKRKTADS